MMNDREISRIFQSLDEGIIIHNRDTTISYFNDSAQRILKMKAKDLAGHTSSEPQWYFVDQDGERLTERDYPVQKVLETQAPLRGFIMGVKPPGSETLIWVQVNGIPVEDKKGQIQQVVISFVDVTSAKEHNFKNAITGLPNRLAMDQFLSLKETPSSLLLLEISNYDALNLYFGYSKGDRMLQFVGQQLEKKVQWGDRLFHTEKNQFAVIFGDQNCHQGRIETIVKELNNSELFYPEESIYLLINSGAALETRYPLQEARLALEQSKGLGRKLSFYTEDLNVTNQVDQELFWIRAFKQMEFEKCLQPYFQPIIDNQTGRIVKYEVLMRIKIEERVFTPGSFLNIAKKYNFYRMLTLILLDKVLQYFSERNQHFSINLNIQDMTDQDSRNQILEKIQSFPRPECITVEIVESEGIKDFQEINRFLNILKVHGVKIAIDDFGSGYSNFAHILHLDADYIKLDGSLIKDIDINKDSRHIVSSIMDFAIKKNIEVIAEFVATEDIFSVVKEMGIPYSQGYYFGKPAPDTDQIEGTTVPPQPKRDAKKRGSLKQLIYTSQVAPGRNKEEIKELLNKAFKNNLEQRITGCIIFDGTYFLQVIEGEENAINQLYEKLVRDKRHRNLHLLGYKNIELRDFGDWDRAMLDDDVLVENFISTYVREKFFLPMQYDYDQALIILKRFKAVLV